MKEYIILFRGINVGGKNIMPMKTLIPLLEQASFKEVSYYIQSGNVILKALTDPYDAIKEIVSHNFNFSPELFLIDKVEFSAVLSANPYNNTKEKYDGKFVHCYFCHNPITLNQAKVDKYLAESESYTVKNTVLYLHAPDGIGRSKLVANITACLNQSATGRNLNTMNKISAILATHKT